MAEGLRSEAETEASRKSEPPWHALDEEGLARELGLTGRGLSESEAAERLERFGPNRLEPPPPPSRLAILLRQFTSPLIYVLFAAAGIALALGEASDAGFIAAVLVLNAVVGFVNEFRAERAVQALMSLVRARARVRRSGRTLDIDGEAVVPGDLLLLESGDRVSADVRFVEARSLRVDESVLTGESLPVDKDESFAVDRDAPLAERRNMAFAGSIVVSGRGMGLVVATGRSTQVGAIAQQVSQVEREPPPLIRRMERFAQRLGLIAIVLCTVLTAVGLAHGQPLAEVLLGAVALAVSAVPEGLPVAITVALAVGVSRMARERVVVRSLPAVEALGSCSVIATDKTGTLTHNELTVERVAVAGRRYEVSGRGYAPEGQVTRGERAVRLAEEPGLLRLLRAALLANEATLVQRDDAPQGWDWSGDPTDVALLALGIKAGADAVSFREEHRSRGAIPFEPERRYAASFHELDTKGLCCVKGAPERVIEMCAHAVDADGSLQPLDVAAELAAAESLMAEGFRVLALADGEQASPLPEGQSPSEPEGLVFLGLVAMDDPPREGVPGAVERCHRAGIHVVMVTGDHATTGRAIAARVGLSDAEEAPLLTGREIEALDDEALQERIARVRVVARAAPADKLRVVRAAQQAGAFVAVTGDGVNDAPALRQADLGVAMGRSGNDVAREAADLIITDDDFSSIVAGVREGRVAYDNVRKVTYLLVSTGAGEVLAVGASLALGLPVPFTAVQLLWLNLVTNGIQDVALAFEPPEPGVLRRAPRPPRERIFDRVMIERTQVAGAGFGGEGQAAIWGWLAEGRSVEEARSLLVQLFVLFEIFHIGNSRSETRSIFRLSPFSNRLLLLGTLTAIGVHAMALYTPFFQGLLAITPPQPGDWLSLVAMAASIVAVMELHKALRRPRT